MLTQETVIKIALLRYSEDETFKRYTDHVISKIKEAHPSYQRLGSIEMVHTLGSDLAKRLLDNFEELKGKIPHAST